MKKGPSFHCPKVEVEQLLRRASKISYISGNFHETDDYFLNNLLNPLDIKGTVTIFAKDDDGLRLLVVTAIFIPVCDYDAKITDILKQNKYIALKYQYINFN